MKGRKRARGRGRGNRRSREVDDMEGDREGEGL